MKNNVLIPGLSAGNNRSKNQAKVDLDAVVVNHTVNGTGSLNMDGKNTNTYQVMDFRAGLSGAAVTIVPSTGLRNRSIHTIILDNSKNAAKQSVVLGGNMVASDKEELASFEVNALDTMYLLCTIIGDKLFFKFDSSVKDIETILLSTR